MLRALAVLLLVACGGSHPAGPVPSNHGGASSPVALAVVFNGQEIWIGNDDLTPEDDPSRYNGALKGLEAALDAADLTHGLPAGSLGLAITYADRAEIRVPIGPVIHLTGAALGTQKDYYNKAGTGMVSGIELAQVELDKTHAAKKVMIVIGDGNDTNNEAARPRLAALKTKLAASGTQVFAITYKSAVSDPSNVITVLAPAARTVSSTGDFTVAVAKVLHDCCTP